MLVSQTPLPGSSNESKRTEAENGWEGTDHPSIRSNAKIDSSNENMHIWIVHTVGYNFSVVTFFSECLLRGRLKYFISEFLTVETMKRYLLAVCFFALFLDVGNGGATVIWNVGKFYQTSWCMIKEDNILCHVNYFLLYPCPFFMLLFCNSGT